MVDVQYAFPDADTCLRAIRPWVDFDLFFVETPLPSDDLDGYAQTARRSSRSRSPPANGSPRGIELAILMDRGKISVVPARRRAGSAGSRRRSACARWRRARADASCRTSGRRASRSPPRRIWPRRRRTAPSSSSCPDELCESSLRRELVVERAADGQRRDPDSTASRPRHRDRPRRARGVRREAAAVTATLC